MKASRLSLVDAVSLRLSKHLKYVKRVNVFYYVVETGGTICRAKFSATARTRDISLHMCVQRDPEAQLVFHALGVERFSIGAEADVAWN